MPHLVYRTDCAGQSRIDEPNRPDPKLVAESLLADAWQAETAGESERAEKYHRALAQLQTAGAGEGGR